MSGQKVEAFERTIDAVNRSDIEAALQSVDAEVEARLVVEVLFGGQATVRRGHQEIRETFRATTQAFAELHFTTSSPRFTISATASSRSVACARAAGRVGP
jgi:hypothetical protein